MQNVLADAFYCIQVLNLSLNFIPLSIVILLDQTFRKSIMDKIHLATSVYSLVTVTYQCVWFFYYYQMCRKFHPSNLKYAFMEVSLCLYYLTYKSQDVILISVEMNDSWWKESKLQYCDWKVEARSSPPCAKRNVSSSAIVILSNCSACRYCIILLNQMNGALTGYSDHIDCWRFYSIFYMFNLHENI